MTETSKNIWDAVDIEINDWIGEWADIYCLEDACIDEFQQTYGGASRLVNMIGLKRRIGKVLAKRGYTKTSTSPPIWVLYPPTSIDPEGIPLNIIDSYRGLSRIEGGIAITKHALIKEYPHIETIAERFDMVEFLQQERA